MYVLNCDLRCNIEHDLQPKNTMILSKLETHADLIMNYI